MSEGLTEERSLSNEQYIFINNVDAYVSKNIGKFLSTQVPNIPAEDEGQEEWLTEDQAREPSGPPKPKKGCFTINGTLSHFKAKHPPFVRDILNYEKKSLFYEHLMKHDLIVYDLTVDPSASDEALWVARTMEQDAERFENRKKLIILTNLLTWAKTKPNDPEDPIFTESEYRRRKPHPNHQDLYELEKEILRLGRKHRKKFVTYVLACGLVYGAEEHIFQNFFRIAWSEQSPLPVYFEGNNVLPTIHVLDLANVIQNIADNPPRQRYIVVKDESNNTLAEIVQAISKQLSNGDIQVLRTPELVNSGAVLQLTLDQLTMDLRIEANAIKEEMQLRWTSENGMVEFMPRLAKEFIDANNLKPLRLCVLGPPGVGKTPLAKELCKNYRLHHIHLKALIFETYKNLMEPIKAMERLLEIRRAEQEAAEAEEAARLRESDSAEHMAEHDGAQDVIEAGQPPAPQEDVNPEHSKLSLVQSGFSSELSETTEFEEFKYTMTADEVPSIRRSTFTDAMNDLEYYPLTPAPTWRTEEELEMLVADAQEQLEILIENTDEDGRLNDETLVRLIIQKLTTRPCQNQGFVLDGFPKTLEQAELLFRPDPDDEDTVGDEKHPGYHRLLTPHHVIILEGSTAYLAHRLRQQAEASGIDPSKARVVLPPWPKGFRQESPADAETLESRRTQSKGGGAGEQTQDDLEGEEKQQGEETPEEKLEQLETYEDRFVRRLLKYKSFMQPAVWRLVNEWEYAPWETFDLEEGTSKVAEEDGVVGKPEVPERPWEAECKKKLREYKQYCEDVIQRRIENTKKRDIYVPEAFDKIDEQPDDTERNVVAYFDIREIHPLVLQMEKDYSLLSDNGAYREECMERIRKAIGRPTAIPLPFCSAHPPRITEDELLELIEQKAQKLRAKKAYSIHDRNRKEAEENAKLLQKQQDDWNGWMDLVKKQNNQCAKAEALPMRHYLMRYVMPDLTKALLACSNIRPEDPVDFVAEYLLRCGSKL
ncbi:hypothetical protein CRM22_003073 [Opisthorchis felineus]|uniref:Adenylate kinase 7 n=1 Tax=Opisthorchis felineus TaxID=147828 RepID=A0A4V3SG27_OPIFE|nr:hypothetical protein CRM22_003073 [Opisthorchis felineus]